MDGWKMGDRGGYSFGGDEPSGLFHCFSNLTSGRKQCFEVEEWHVLAWIGFLDNIVVCVHNVLYYPHERVPWATTYLFE